MIAPSPYLRRAVGLGSATLLAAAGIAFAGPGSASATVPVTRYVAASGTDGDNDCTVKAQPCLTIGHAVNVANGGDTISIGAGTFAEEIPIHISLTFTGAGSGASGTQVTGSFDASETFALLAPDTGPAPVVTFNHLAISTKNEAAPAILISAGSATVDNSSVTSHGDAIDDEGGALTVENSSVSDSGGGGIVANDDATAVTVTASTVSDNADEGISTGDDVTLDVENSTVSGDSEGIDAELGADTVNTKAATDPAGDGGSDVTVSHSTISNNAFAGIDIEEATSAAIDHSTLNANTGAGLLVIGPDASATLRTSTVSNTRAGRNKDLADGAGVIDVDGATVTVSESTLSGNTGQGLLVQNGTATVDNSTITATVAPPVQEGAAAVPVALASGAVVVGVEEPVVRSSVIAGKLHLTPAAPPATHATLEGTLVAQNTTLPDCSGPITDSGYNLSSDHSCGFTTAKHSLINAMAKLGSLAGNGGPTKTVLPGLGSAARDAIASGAAGCTAGATDQRGVAKPQPAGSRCDIGAVEVAEKPITITPGTLTHGTVGTAYTLTFTATGGNGPAYVFSLAPGSSLPAGLTLHSDGTVTGTPTAAGTFSFTISVDDPVLKRFTLVIEAAAPLAVTGTDIAPMLGAGVGLLLLGALLVTFGRRQRAWRFV